MLANRVYVLSALLVLPKTSRARTMRQFQCNWANPKHEWRAFDSSIAAMTTDTFASSLLDVRKDSRVID